MTKPPRRSLSDLINEAEPGLDLVREWAEASPHPVELLPVASADGERTLERLQITSRSPLGSIALSTGGVWIDHGWVRLLGGGCDRMPVDLATFNYRDAFYGDGPQRLPGSLIVGWDAIGGFFALRWIDPDAPPLVHYHGPDTLSWENLVIGYSEFVNAMCSDSLESFYDGPRWTSWQEEVAVLPGDQIIHVAPPLWSAGPPLAVRSRRPVPLEEIWGLYTYSYPLQINGQPNAPDPRR